MENCQRSHLDEHAGTLRLQKYGQFWAVYDLDDTLVVVTVYKKGAQEVIRRFDELEKRTLEHCRG